MRATTIVVPVFMLVSEAVVVGPGKTRRAGRSPIGHRKRHGDTTGAGRSPSAHAKRRCHPRARKEEDHDRTPAGRSTSDRFRRFASNC